MNEANKRKYARLLLEVGVDLQQGQKLAISSEQYHWDFLVMLAEEAYKMGAAYVEVDAPDPRLLKARVDHAAEDSLDGVLGWTSKKFESMIDEKWARLSLFGPTDPDLIGTLDGKKLGVIQKVSSKVAKPFGDACGAGIISWCVAAVPTPAWAAKVFDEPASEELENRLWGEISEIMQIEQADPCEFWREKSKMIQKRAQSLTTMKLDYVRFKGPGTDLKVYLHEKSVWLGGGIHTDDGREFIPNLPTEECFTTPNMHRTEGRVQVVRPVEVMGQQVQGAWFVFKEGKVVEYGAEKNQEALDLFFAMCPQSKELGELALVDGSSPIFQSGHVFHCILYDENASCHIALGNGYPMGVEGALAMNKDEKLDLGINVSLVHTDFMIGGPEVDVLGYDAEGNEVELLRGGTFSPALS